MSTPLIAEGTLLRVKPEFHHYGIAKYLRVQGFYTGIPSLAICVPGGMIECRGIWGFSWGDRLPRYKVPQLASQCGVDYLHKYYDVVTEFQCAQQAACELAERYLDWFKLWGHTQDPQRANKGVTYWAALKAGAEAV